VVEPAHSIQIPTRDVATEKTQEKTGTSPAVSSHQALFFNLISPHFIRRLATRLTGGGKKYGLIQWRQGVNDADYVADRFNHMMEHLMAFMDHGNEGDDNLGAMVWALHCLSEVERVSPEALNHVCGMCNLNGQAATVFTEAEMKARERFHGTPKVERRVTSPFPPCTRDPGHSGPCNGIPCTQLHS
jgi:hypothetical protein